MTRELKNDDLTNVTGAGTAVDFKFDGKQSKPIPEPPVSNPVEDDDPNATPGSGDNVGIDQG